MIERRKFIVMTGPSFAGKSTLAKEIAERTNSFYNASTQVARDLDLPTSVRLLTLEERIILATEHDRRAEDKLRTGISVVHDSVARTRERRDEIRTLARANHAEPIIIFLQTPFEIIVARWEANKHKPETERRSDPPLKLVEKIYKDFEPPTPDEEHIVFDSNVHTIPEWITQHGVLLGGITK